MIAGVDVSKHAIDVVILEDDGPIAYWHRFELDDFNCWAAMDSVRLRVPNSAWWTSRGVDLVAIEDPFSKSRQTAKCYGLLIGAVAARIGDLPVLMGLSPGKWKDLTVGSPTATKQAVGFWVLERWPNHPDVVEQDALDAYCIAWAARKLHQQGLEAA